MNSSPFFDRDSYFEQAAKFLHELELVDWRKAVREDRDVNRWSTIFDTLEPPEALAGIVAVMCGQMSAPVTPRLARILFFGILNAYTHGYADACSALADEEITLWNGEPLDFPWDSEVK